MDGVTDETRLAMSFINSYHVDFGAWVHESSLYYFYWFCICLKFCIIIKRKKLWEIKAFCVGCVV